MSVAIKEQDKYSQMWEVPQYKDVSPGLERVQRFMDMMVPEPGSTLIDLGCGAGVAGLEFERRGLRVSYIDITDVGLESAVSRDRFIKQPLWGNWPRLYKNGFDYGYSCDVLEHIPPEYTMLVLDRIISTCRTSWLQIALIDENFGATIDQVLHMTVRPFTWWLERLRDFGIVVEARDLYQRALYIVEQK